MIRPSLVLLGLVIGIALGVLYGWVISPVKYTDTAPSALRADYREQYLILIAQSYANDSDLDRARARLAALAEPDPAAALTALAQRLAADGKDSSAVALLAAELGATIVAAPSSATPAPSATFTPLMPTNTPLPTATLFPTLTPTATPVYDYTLLAQEPYCNDSQRQSLIIVDVIDTGGTPVPGIKVVVAWAEGQDSFVTGLKPEISDSYGDFLMSVGTTYSVQVGSRTPAVGGITAPTCTTPDGIPYAGAVRLVFQRK